MISAICAIARNGMLGANAWLPWDIPEELAYFESTVAGAALVMGRRTYETNALMPPDSFIVTRQPDLRLRPGCRAVSTLEAGLRGAMATGKPVFVIGGATLYAAAWPWCQHFYLTRIDRAFPGDTLFPAEIPLDSWRVISDRTEHYQERTSGERVGCRFMIYEQDNPRLLAP